MRTSCGSVRRTASRSATPERQGQTGRLREVWIRPVRSPAPCKIQIAFPEIFPLAGGVGISVPVAAPSLNDHARSRMRCTVRPYMPTSPPKSLLDELNQFARRRTGEDACRDRAQAGEDKLVALYGVMAATITSCPTQEKSAKGLKSIPDNQGRWCHRCTSKRLTIPQPSCCLPPTKDSRPSSFRVGVSSLLGGACLSAAPAEFTHAFSAAARPRPRRQVGGI